MSSFRLQNAKIVLGATLAFFAVSPLLQTSAYSQATTTAGAIQGTISDPKGAIIPGASITITNRATGAKKEIESDSSGFYSVASLIPGQYQVSVTDPGFARQTTTLTVQIGTTTNGNMTLKVGEATEEVVVSSETLQVNTVQSTVEGVLTAQQIDNLPVSGRNFLDLSQLEPGVQLQSGETFDPTKAGYSSISFNGVNGRTARIMLDGVPDEPFVARYIERVDQLRCRHRQLPLGNQRNPWTGLWALPRRARRRRRKRGRNHIPLPAQPDGCPSRRADLEG